MIAAIQGILTGVAFWTLGIVSPVIWGVVTALCSMLPIIGTTLVFLPAICMLVFSGHWIKGLLLLVWGDRNRTSRRQRLKTLSDRRTRQAFYTYLFFALLGGG